MTQEIETNIPPTELTIHPDFNPRTDTELSDDFVRSIADHGVLQPILVREDGDKLVVIDGHRRLRAALQAELPSVPICNHGDRTDEEAILISYVANTAQKTFSVQERATTVAKLRNLGVADADIQETLGISERTFSEYVTIMRKGTPDILESVSASSEEERLPGRVAARLAGLPKNVQAELLPQLRGLSVREGLARIRKYEELNADADKTPKRGRPKSSFSLASDAKSRAKELSGILHGVIRNFSVEFPGDTNDELLERLMNEFSDVGAGCLAGAYTALRVFLGDEDVRGFGSIVGDVATAGRFIRNPEKMMKLLVVSGVKPVKQAKPKKEAKAPEKKAKKDKKASENVTATPAPANEAPKKKRGRPKKADAVVSEPEKKPAAKRGRPKKVEATAEAPKKRGRPKKEVEQPAAEAPKRPRGRPRKQPETSNVVALPPRTSKSA